MSETSAPITWRTFLDSLCRQMRADEKQALIANLGVRMTTLNRWRNGKDWPNAINLKRLLSFLSPVQRQQFLLLAKEDPRLWARVPVEIRANVPEKITSVGGLLDQFCLRMLRMQRDTPDRLWQLASSILREGLERLETHPTRTGLEMIVAKCMPPRGGYVRSLRLYVGMGTSPWRGDLHYEKGFLGIESVAGYAVSKRHGEMIPDLARASAQPRGLEQCSAAFPIKHTNGIAGALLVSAREPHYFTPERMELIEIFADIIRLAFYDNEFYEAVDLGVMPSWKVQEAYFTSLQEFMEAEERVLQQIEDELLKIAGSTKSTDQSEELRLTSP
jgi:hypothetical protein